MRNFVRDAFYLWGVLCLVLMASGSLWAFDAYPVWDGDVDNLWSEQYNWHPQGVPNNSDGNHYHPEINFGDVQLDMSTTIDDFTLDSGASVTLNYSKVFRLAGAGGASTNNGHFVFSPRTNAGNYHCEFIVEADHTLTGSGYLDMSSPYSTSYLKTENGAVLTVDDEQTVRGSGYIDAAIINKGTIRADEASKTLSLYNHSKTNEGVFEALNSSKLYLNNITVTNDPNSGVLAARQTGEISYYKSSVLDGVFSGSGSHSISNSCTFANAEVASETVLDIGYSSALNGRGVFNNNGQIHMSPRTTSSNYHSHLNAVDDLTFRGGGRLTLEQPYSSSYLQSAAGVTVYQAAGHTIEGAGSIQANLENNGLVTANAEGKALYLNTNDMTNNSVFKAEDGGELSIESIAIENGAGTITAEADSMVTYDRAGIVGGVLSGTGDHYLDNGISTFDHVTIDQTDVTVNFSNTFLACGGSLLNNGAIILRPRTTSSGYHSVFKIDAPLSLYGDGELTLTYPYSCSYVQADNGAMLTNTAHHVIAGAGVVQASLTNDGLVRAEGGTLTFDTNPKINNNTIEVLSDAELDINSVQVDNTTGTITADGTVNYLRAWIVGGTLDGSGRHVLDNGQSTFDDVTIDQTTVQVGWSDTLLVSGGRMTNNGQINLVPRSTGNGYHSVFKIDSSAGLAGCGELVLSTPYSTSFIQADAGAVLTNTADHVIRGAGYIQASLINDGLLKAEGGTLTLETNSMTNNNVINVRADAALTVNAIELDNTDGSIESQGQTTFKRATVVGGIMTGLGDYVIDNGQSVFDAVAIEDTSVTVGLSDTLYADGGTLLNNGTITLSPHASSSGYNSYFKIGADLDLDGDGELVLTTPRSTSYIQADNEAVLTNTVDQTIRGAGYIQAGLINDGVLVAEGGTMVLDTTGKINNNVIDVDSGGGLAVNSVQLDNTNGTVTSEGTVAFNKAAVLGGVLAGSGTYTVEGGLTTFEDVTFENTTVEVGSSNTLAAVGTITNHGAMYLLPHSTSYGYHSYLTAANDVTFTGTGSVDLSTPRSISYIHIADGAVLTNAKGHTFSGTGAINGAFVNGGIVAPETWMSCTGSFVNDPNGVLDIYLSNDGYSRIEGSAVVRIDGGTVRVSLASDYVPAAADSWMIVTGASVTGTFDRLIAPLLPGGYGFVLEYDVSGQVWLRVTECPELIADISNDGVVDMLDLSLLVDQWLSMDCGDCIADIDADGDVDLGDFAVLSMQWLGQECGSF